jgi:DNA invertase Pin-like site-specific DNA recombinase
MKWIGYVRVSTEKQGRSGLGLEAQLKMISDYVAADGGDLVAIYEEVETGKKDDRPELMKALKHANLIGGRLLVGKLDRLSRSLHMITSLQKSNINFAVCDMPGCDSFSIHIYGALAQREVELISSRTKAALAARKAKGLPMGTNNLPTGGAKDASVKGIATIQRNANESALKVRATVGGLVAAGLSLRKIATQLNDMGVTTPRNSQWTAQAVKNAITRGNTAGHAVY